LRLQRPAQRLAAEQGRLDMLAQRQRASLGRALQMRAQALDHRAQRLASAMHRGQARQVDRLESRAHRLAALDPRAVLTRGYAWIESEQGEAIVSAQALQVGQGVRAVWADGSAQARVTAVQADDPPAD
jgi:exodeoxyribonuclease VII large subunit